MENIAGSKSSLSWAVQLSVVALVVLWLFPTVGLLVSSFRTADQISSSGWWQALFPTQQNLTLRAADPDDEGVQKLVNGIYVVEGNLFGAKGDAKISVWGSSSRSIDAYKAGETAELKDGETLTVQENGDYRWTSPEKLTGRGQRAFVTAETPPEFTFANYQNVLFSGDSTDSMAKAFFNTLTVTIPATIIPIVIAAFAAYALAWMDFPGRAILIAIVVGLLVVPLQLALIPLLRLHLGIGIGKGYLERYTQQSNHNGNQYCPPRKVHPGQCVGSKCSDHNRNKGSSRQNLPVPPSRSKKFDNLVGHDGGLTGCINQKYLGNQQVVPCPKKLEDRERSQSRE